MSYTDTFERIFLNYVKRPGAQNLLNWLKSTDFFTAPASSRFHCAYAGGLCEHSINVYIKIKQLYDMEKAAGSSIINGISEESLVIVALLHDVCKAEFYKVEMRNVKNEFGQWEKVPYYAIDEKLPMGHGEKSVYLIQKYMQLTDNEAMAINWHMGGFDKRVIGGEYSISNAFEMDPLAVLLQAADFLSTYISEARK